MSDKRLERVVEYITLQNETITIQNLCNEIFNTMSYSNMNGILISDCLIIQTVLNIPLPLAERILNVIKKDKWTNFREETKFEDLVMILYKEDITSKIQFFFKVLDYNDNKKIEKDYVLFLFSHIDKRSLPLVNALFYDTNSINYSDFMNRIEKNVDLVLFFYFFLFIKRTINPEVLTLFEKLPKNHTVSSILIKHSLGDCTKKSGGSQKEI